MSGAKQVIFEHLPKANQRAILQARDIELAYFKANPTAKQFERAIIPGEALDMPNYARVRVFRIGPNKVARAYFFETTGN
jgi:hypothetical protein